MAVQHRDHARATSPPISASTAMRSTSGDDHRTAPVSPAAAGHRGRGRGAAGRGGGAGTSLPMNCRMPTAGRRSAAASLRARGFHRHRGAWLAAGRQRRARVPVRAQERPEHRLGGAPARQKSARCADAVSYAWLKDRHAVTEQWFSVQMPGREAPMPCGFTGSRGIDGVEVLAVTRNSPQKLRRGALAGNRFRIVVRELDGRLPPCSSPAGHRRPRRAELVRRTALRPRQRQSRTRGGCLAGTLRERDRHKRGLYLSAAARTCSTAISPHGSSRWQLGSRRCRARC